MYLFCKVKRKMSQYLQFERGNVLNSTHTERYKYFCYVPDTGSFYLFIRPFGLSVRLSTDLNIPNNIVDQTVDWTRILLANLVDLCPECLSLMRTEYDQKERKRIFFKFYEKLSDTSYRLRSILERNALLEWDYPEKIISNYNNELQILKDKYRQKIKESFRLFVDHDDHSKQYYYNLIG